MPFFFRTNYTVYNERDVSSVVERMLNKVSRSRRFESYTSLFNF